MTGAETGLTTRRCTPLVRVAFAASLAFAPLAAASAQDAAPGAPATSTVAAPVPAVYVYVALTTAQGTIVLALDKTHAPLTTANFLKYVDTKRYDGAPLYRAMHLDYGNGAEGLLQGGIRDASRLLPPVAHESTNQTGLRNKAGTIAMARFAPGTAKSDFLLLVSDMPALDAEPGNPGKDPGAGFAAFGHIVAGMDIVRKIWDEPRSPTLGEGVMKGQMLAQPVKILTARRTSVPAAVAP